jgi:protein-serine/threonine kinase
VDWWALGVIIYEMLIGYAPFTCENNEEIYYKIEHHQQYLYFPPEVHISFEVIDLISRLLTDPENRLGRNGTDEIKNHRWFSDVNWSELKNSTAPFIPDLDSDTDTKYFDKYD